MRLVKEIKSKSGVVHFKRWKVITIPWVCTIYIHGIYMADEDEHLHSHPWNIWTMIIRGSYLEELLSESKKEKTTILRKPFSMAYRNSERFHKIKKLESKKVFTLALVGRRKLAEWGYHTEDGFVDHITYRNMKNGI